MFGLNISEVFRSSERIDPRKIPAKIDLGKLGKVDYEAYTQDSYGRRTRIKANDPERTFYFQRIDKPMDKPSCAKLLFSASCVALQGVVLGLAVASGSVALVIVASITFCMAVGFFTQEFMAYDAARRLFFATSVPHSPYGPFGLSPGDYHDAKYSRC